MSKIPEIFGSLVFNESVMKDRLPKDTYKALKKTRDEGIPLDAQVANVVANAMKNWAIEKGATHYTHWFQPMTGITAGKHDGFISPTGDGRVIMEFRASRMRPASRMAVFAPLSKPAATPRGTRPLTRSSETAPCLFRPYSVLTAEKLWTKKRRCCARSLL